MADEPTATAPVEAQAPTVVEPTAAAETNGEAPIAKEDEETAGKQATTEVNAPNGENTAEAAEGPSAPAADGTPATGGKDKRRKSSVGVPEHKSKKLNKKRSMPNLHLQCQPGDLYWARLKGYPPWPAVICDESMLPESLLMTRPVSTTRADGGLRDDFKEGGKNAKERTFPIMFLSTNEFAWMVNTSLTKLDPAELEGKSTAKMTKALKNAYDIAKEAPDLNFFKEQLKLFQEETAAIEKEIRDKEEKEAEKAAKKAEKEATEKEKEETEGADKKKKKARKSKAVDEEDVEMEDAEAPKSSKKRKKNTDSDGEVTKPKKTPKVTKLNAPKTSNGEVSAKKASTSKPKKKVSAPKAEDEEEAEEKKTLTEAEKLQIRERAVLYLRHRLQKGFLSRDTQPKEEEMPGMADLFSQLEGHETLEPSIIRNTKIHKVLKAIVKLSSIPKDEDFNFKKRSHAILEIWNKRMESDGGEKSIEPGSAGAGDAKSAEPETNGEAKLPAAVEVQADKAEAESEETAAAAEKADEFEEKVEAKSAETEGEKEALAEGPEAPVEKTDPGNEAQDEVADGDGSMMTAPEITEETTAEA